MSNQLPVELNHAADAVGPNPRTRRQYETRKITEFRLDPPVFFEPELRWLVERVRDGKEGQ
jgi:hypothetical protein